MALSLRKTIVVFVCLRVDTDIPVMQKQMQISESKVAKRCKRKKKKVGDVKYVGNVADGVIILLAIQDWKPETASNLRGISKADRAGERMKRTRTQKEKNQSMGL